MLVYTSIMPKDPSLYVRRYEAKDRQGIDQIEKDAKAPFVVLSKDDDTVLDFGSLEGCIQSCIDNAFNGEIAPEEYFYVDV